MKISLQGSSIEITLDPQTQYRERSLRARGARFQKKTAIYTLPLLAVHLDWLRKFYSKDVEWDSRLIEMIDLDFCFPFVDRGQDFHPQWDRLFPFQKATVDFLLSTPRPGALIALSPRLGKTITSSIAIDVLRLENVLVVTTPTLLPTWVDTVREWVGWDFEVCHGVDPKMNRVVTTYESIFKTGPVSRPGVKKPVFLRESLRRHWDVVIFDESINFKNRDAYRSDAAKQLRVYADRVWLLSGSPTSQYSDDLYSQLEIIYPKAFTSYWRFAEQYCIIEESVWAKQVVGDREEIDIQKDFRDLIFVRSLQDVVKLPGVNQRTILVQMTPVQETAYHEMVRHFIADVEGKTITAESSLSRRIRLQQIVSTAGQSSAKVDEVVRLLESGEVVGPVLCWNHWRETGDLLEKRLGEKYRDRVRRIYGGDDDRDTKIRDYQQGRADILIASLGVGRFGLDLSNTQTAIYVDKSENADFYVQSFFRVVHLKMDHEVDLIHLVTPKTTDILIHENLSGKSRSISRITDIELAMLLKGLEG